MICDTHYVLFRFVVYIYLITLALRLNQFPTHLLWYNEKLIPYKSEGITKDFQNSSIIKQQQQKKRVCIYLDNLLLCISHFLFKRSRYSFIN